MKKVSVLLAALLAAPLMLHAGDPPALITKKADLQKSKIEWVGKKVTGQHDGTVMLKDGALEVENGRVVGGQFTMDMTTIEVTDIEDPATNAKLKGHLMSDDFFSVEKYPTARFVITDVQPAGSGKIDVTGDLTIKGITHAVNFPATVSNRDGQTRARAEFEIDRTKWNVRYGSGSFFEGLGDKVIYDDFTIKLDLVTR
ncbi:MAG: YceI family protein [Catalinimonas sp.]